MNDATSSIPTALVLILHGSPRKESSRPAQAVAQTPELTARFPHVMLAYMECNEPTIPDAIRQCAQMGYKKIILVPYMLHAGRHLVLDVPGLISQGASDFPEVEILLGDPVGASSAISVALEYRAYQALKENNIGEP